MRVLSLYNGISCGRVAFERVGIPVTRYISYEIDKYANQIAQANYPDDEYYGDVTTEDFTKYAGEIDIVIGGSPCTHWSIAKKDREITIEGIGYELFSHFVRAIKETGAKYFLYENNHSIHKDIKAEITKDLGVEFIMINSALVSAQQRKRCYWNNIPNVTQPEDKGILLKDILESGITEKDKSFCVDATYYKGGNLKSHCEKNRRIQIFEPVCLKYIRTDEGKQLRKEYEAGNIKHGFNEHRIWVPKDDGKTNTLTTVQKDNMIVEPICAASRGRYKIDGVRQDHKQKCEGLTTQYIEMRKDEKTNCLTTVQKDNLIIERPIRIGHYNTGGQADRVYSVRGKSVCLSTNGGGRGAKTGLYKIDLPDGDYIIRKLTPLECERLQNLPDRYTNYVSNTQRYKGIGNGWTIDVIAHILSFIK